MRGSLILRLVDIMLLLLLSLMAAASIEPLDADLPITFELEDKGQLTEPLNVAVTEDGTLLLEGGTPVSEDELNEALASHAGHLLLYANADAPAYRIIEVNRMARAADWRAAFIVQRKETQKK